VDEIVSGYDIMASFYKHGNYFSGSIKGREFLDQMSAHEERLSVQLNSNL
jgi:hypothetical protein